MDSGRWRVSTRAGSIAAFLAVILSACTDNIPVTGDRYFNTSLREGESIGLVLASYGACYHHNNQECGPESDLSAKQREFENCVVRAIKAENPAVDVVPSEKFMPILARNSSANTGTALDAQLENPALREELTAMGLKYLVAMEVQTEESERRTGGGVPNVAAAPAIWIIGRGGDRTTWFVSRIFESISGEETGHLDTELSGADGWFVPVLVIIPLPPIPFSTATESRTCTAMGEALAKFITGAGNSGSEQLAN